MFLFVGLFVLWLILNGRITLEICIFGIALSGVLTWFSIRFLSEPQDRVKHSWKYYPLLLVYFLLLLWEVIVANAKVFRICLAGRLSFSPVLVYFDPKLKLSSSRVLLSNSITLTPGTITVQAEENRFCVHALDRSLAEGIENCRFVRLLHIMEGA